MITKRELNSQQFILMITQTVFIFNMLSKRKNAYDFLTIFFAYHKNGVLNKMATTLIP